MEPGSECALRPARFARATRARSSREDRMSGEDASKVGKADPDFDPESEEKNMTKEQHARAIRADRGGENPEQSLLDALEDYIILCGGEPLEDVSRLRIDIALRSTRYRLSRIRGYHSGPYPRPDRAFRRALPRGERQRERHFSTFSNSLAQNGD